MICVDTGAFRFVCRVDPRCGKKFVRADLLNRHEERHQNKKNKQAMSEDGNSPPPRIAPSPPRGPSPSGDLSSQMNRSITIPMSNSPESDEGYDDRDSDNAGSSPEDMAIDSAPYPYQTSTPQQQSFHQSYHKSNPSYGRQATSGQSSNYNNGGFVAINQSFSVHTIPLLEDFNRAYPQADNNRSSEPVNIPRSTFSPPVSLSPPVGENTNVFAGNYTGVEVMGDMVIIGQENWNDILIHNAASGASFPWEAGTFPDQFPDAQQMYPTQSNEVQPYEGRRNSVFYPNVLSHPN